MQARAYGIVQCFAPVIGTAREPRWGRVVETYGECPFLTSNLALMMTLGMQGGDPSGATLNTSIVAEPKHYVAHSAPQAGTNTAPVHAGTRELLESFAPQFEWAVRYGGARGVMAAYHELDGVPSCANNYTLTTLLREEYGFKGWVLADDGAVKMMEVTHFTAADPADSISQFLTAGGNCQYYDYEHPLYEAAIVGSMANGTLATSIVDQRVAEILSVKSELGLFDAPYINASDIQNRVNTQAARDLASRAARESIVLLKNQPASASTGIDAAGMSVDQSAAAPQNILPLNLTSSTPQTIALIGPSIDVIRDGDYSGQGVSQNFVTFLEGMQAAVAASGSRTTTLLFEQGCGVQTGELVPIRHSYLSYTAPGMAAAPASASSISSGVRGAAASATTTAPAVQQAGILGSYWPGNASGVYSTGAPASFTRVDYDINFAWYAYGPTGFYRDPINGTKFYNSTFTVVWEGQLTPPVTAKNITVGLTSNNDPVRLTINGNVVIDTISKSKNPQFGSIDVQAGVPMDLQLLYSRASMDPGAEITLQWSLIENGDEDMGIQRAVAAAATADVAIVAIGENDNTVGEGIDSSTLLLPGRQADLIAAVMATGTPVILVLAHGRPLAIPDLAASPSVAAIVSTWFGGQAQGAALADVITGKYNPAGRTPMTWPASVGTLPVFYNAKPSARTGCYIGGCIAGYAPVFPFGFGLSYTSFNYTNLVISSNTIGPTDVLFINVTVTNTGAMDGEDVPQLYVRDAIASVTTPMKQMKGFERIFLAAGSSTMASFSIIPERDLYLINRDYIRTVEPGLFTFFVAQHSAPGDNDVQLKGNFTVGTSDGRPFVVRMGDLMGLYPDAA